MIYYFLAKGNIMLLERVELRKNLSTPAYDALIKSIDFDHITDVDELICLFVVSILQADETTFERIKGKINELDISDEPQQVYFYQIALGQYHYRKRQYRKTLIHYVKATEVAYESNDGDLIADSNRYMSIAYRKMGDLEQANHYIEKAVRFLNKAKLPIVNAHVYLTYGLILTDSKAYNHAIKTYKTALDQFHLISNYTSYINYKILLFNLYEVSDMIGDYESSKYYYNEANKIIDHSQKVINDILPLYQSQICKKKGLYQDALEHLEQYIDNLSVGHTSEYTHNKDEIKVNLDQIHDLKVKNNALLARMNQMFDTIETSKNQIISFELEEKINQAIVKDFIKPYFQLKWSVKDKSFIGAEALIRWIDGEISVPPNLFISEAENSSIIIKLSEKIIGESIKFVKRVSSQQKNFVVSINISPYQLANQDLVKLFKNELILHNVDPKHIEIEITERSFLDQNPKIIEQLYQLKELGIRLALDDFGTGYSSLSCVNDFPIDIIKIDRSLIGNIESDKKSYKLLAGIIRMMNELELETVAEGVETQSQAEIIENLGCDYIQGYFYAKPESAEDALQRLSLT